MYSFSAQAVPNETVMCFSLAEEGSTKKMLPGIPIHGYKEDIK